MHPTLKALIESGIPCSKADFHAAVNNADDVPENYFSDKSSNKSRRAKMWYTPHGLICAQENTQKELKHFIVPLPSIKFANVNDHQTSDAIPDAIPAIDTALDGMHAAVGETPAKFGVKPRKPRTRKPKENEPAN